MTAGTRQRKDRDSGRAPELVTFGCRLNALESDIIRDRAAAAGLTDLVVVNTCAVTAEAERQARQAIRRARRRNPDARIVVTGCAAQIAPDAYAGLPEVDHVMGNAEKLEAASWARLAGDEAAPRVAVGDIMAVRETASHLADGAQSRSRAFLQIQQGCDHRCTFCVIPFGRGNNRSVPLGALVDSARQLAAQGYGEIVLTGVDITGYGADLPGRPRLGQAVRRLLALVPELRRLRLSSVDPSEIDEELWQLIATEPRLMPHLHLSLQAGDDLILKRMKRRHSRAQAVAVCARARALRPDIVFGADLIAGFPTEDEAMFANSLALVEDCGLTFLHVFPYSARAGTPAARMPQVPVAERRARAARLRAAGAAAQALWLAGRVGSDAEVLVEEPLRARDRWFAPVTLEAEALPGALLQARIVAADGDGLVGRVAA
ncbi:MAG: tRNA (N(6)-L-threonylcarbamoyladenosine(37)-C(2))-methylthiotransferase MtaB [Sneathiellaceae bacterium]